MSQMRQRWKKRPGGEDGEERKGAAEAGTMVGVENRRKEHRRERQKGRGKREGQRWEAGAARSVLGEVRRIIHEISEFSGHCGGMGSGRHTAEPCWTKDRLLVKKNMFRNRQWLRFHDP